MSLLILGLESDLKQCHELHRQLPECRKLLYTGSMSAAELFAVVSGVLSSSVTTTVFSMPLLSPGGRRLASLARPRTIVSSWWVGSKRSYKYPSPAVPAVAIAFRQTTLPGWVDTERVKRTVRGMISAEHYGNIPPSHNEAVSVEPCYTPPPTED